MNLFEMQILAIGFGLGACVTNIVHLVMRLNVIKRNKREREQTEYMQRIQEMQGKRGNHERI